MAESSEFDNFNHSVIKSQIRQSRDSQDSQNQNQQNQQNQIQPDNVAHDHDHLHDHTTRRLTTVSPYEDTRSVQRKPFIADYMLNPMSTIIELAVLSTKPIGTKLYVADNTIYMDEPGVFQALCRFTAGSSSDDVHLLFNPILIACKTFNENVRAQSLMTKAIVGLKRLRQTYENIPLVSGFIGYYITIIGIFLTNKTDRINVIFEGEPAQRMFYTDVCINELNGAWTHDSINLVANLFDNQSISAVEQFIKDINPKTRQIIRQGVRP